jgi:antibiotic biosynthesis monooxygenase (ABM) superfamily enzyme
MLSSVFDVLVRFDRFERFALWARSALRQNLIASRSTIASSRS